MRQALRCQGEYHHYLNRMHSLPLHCTRSLFSSVRCSSSSKECRTSWKPFHSIFLLIGFRKKSSTIVLHHLLDPFNINPNHQKLLLQQVVDCGQIWLPGLEVTATTLNSPCTIRRRRICTKNL